MYEGNICYNNGYSYSDEKNSYPFESAAFPSYDKINISESESNIGITVQSTTTTRKFENFIKQRYRFDYSHKYKEQSYSNFNDAFSLLFKMNTHTTAEQEKYEREDNCRIMIGRDVFNKYLKHKIEKFIRDNKLILCFENFPRDFIFKVTNKTNKPILDKTIEELIESKELYNDTKPKSHFDNNLKVIKVIKENENKCQDIINISGNNFDNFLKKKYRDLIKDYSHSIEYEQKVAKIKSKKGIKEANKYKFFTEKFIENYLN